METENKEEITVEKKANSEAPSFKSKQQHIIESMIANGDDPKQESNVRSVKILLRKAVNVLLMNLG